MQPRPVVNVEEFIGKTVGQRALASERGLQKTLNQALKTAASLKERMLTFKS
jgi:hypothetical protein